MTLKYLPLFLDVVGEPCLVVGGGEVAGRKVDMLLRAGASVTVVSPVLGGRLKALLDDNRVIYHARNYQTSDLDDRVLVIAATDNQQLNQQVSEDANAKRLPVNVVDQPELCRFILPAVIDRSPVVVAVSTGGASPVLARLLRSKLESLIPAGYGRLAQLMSEMRESVKQRFNTVGSRRRFWESLLDGPVPEMVFGGQDDAAKRAIQAAIDTDDDKSFTQGEVYLVGAGSGDPDLLTFKALRLMQKADVVLYDRLVSPAVLDLVRRDAERIYVGKKRDYHAVRQEEISANLVSLAQAGKVVVRLKGGDPFIFGRGGEEIATLADNSIPFQVVPGITAASGCACYAGIPLTHRDYAQSVMFVTGQLKDGSLDLNWDALVQPQQTVVIYMGLMGLPVLCSKLIEQGMSADMPIALVERGTMPEQRVLTGTLSTLPAIVAGETMHAPTLIIIGEVVALHDQLAWYEGESNSV